MSPQPRSGTQLWGGVECTVNRVRERYFNQLRRSGHWTRNDDLDRFAELGLRTLRFPLLWETVAPESPTKFDWSWADEGLARVGALGIRPIVGLLHHGSGPRYTDLTDPLFPEKFCHFASEVARRYPWLDAFTPINEPLTTARFSGLYGHWYPHAGDDATFIKILLNQLRATLLAMASIREINPAAILIQTEDLGRTFSTRAMRYQADFDNERRWLTWDLLLGKVRPGDRMWDYLRSAGTLRKEIEFFSAQRCEVTMLGINHYVTSDRYLDEKVTNYPLELRGNNGRQAYADDAAVRARPTITGGFRTVIAEAHNRYALPMALTEVHLGCGVDEQMRWFHEAWTSANITQQRGMDVRAVTAWALLGSFDWDSLVTREASYYEPGAFDLRRDGPHPTRYAEMLRKLAHGKVFEDPVLQSSGWWRERSRLRLLKKVELAA